MTGRTAWSARAVVGFALAVVGASSVAQEASNCLEQAFDLTSGRFSAAGRKVDDSGNLSAFEEEVEIRPASDSRFQYLVAGVLIAEVSVGEQYTITTVDEDGEPAHEPIFVSYSCSVVPTTGSVQLLEEWTTPSGEEGHPWQYRQTKLIEKDNFSVALVGREADSSLPYIVLNEFEAVRLPDPERSPPTNG